MAANIPNIITVPFQECASPASPGWTATAGGGFSDTKIYKCAWEDQFTLMSQMTGSVVTLSGVQRFRLPHRHPDIPNAIATSASFVQGLGDPGNNGNFVTWKFALVKVVYETADGGATEDESGEPYLREDFSGFAESFNMGGQYFWSPLAGGKQDNPLPQTVTPVKNLPGVVWSLNWLSLSRLPLAFISLVGKCNDAAMTSRRFGITFPAQSLLYGQPKISATYNTDGSHSLTASLSLKYKPTGWNKLFGKPGDEKTANNIYAQGATTPLEFAEPADFSPLYTIGS